MPGQFDPYHKWLGIPPEEQPPHYYRLLAIRIFEDDVDVIEAAADQRMAHLRTLQTGKNAELSQRLLNELAAARACLVDERKRAQYNQRLKRQQSTREEASAANSRDEQALAPPSGGPNKSSSAGPAARPVAALEPSDNLADLDPLESMPPPSAAGGYGASAGYYGPPQSAWPGYAPRRRKAWLIPAIIVASILLVLALIAFFAVLAVIVFYADSGGAPAAPQTAESTSDDDGATRALLSVVSKRGTSLSGADTFRTMSSASWTVSPRPRSTTVSWRRTETAGTSASSDASMSRRDTPVAQSFAKMPPIKAKTQRRGPRL
jgi:hypothetical protein